jgi:predicted dehydrogenase
VKVVGLVDISRQILQRAQDELGVDPAICFTSLGRALASVDADAVVISASLPGHKPLIRTALQHGKHVLVEKPFVATAREAQDLIALARRKRRILMVSQNYRFYPAVRAVQKVLRSGRLGKVSNVAIDFRRYSNRGDPKRKHFHIVEPLLLDMAVHQFDLLRGVLGCEPKSVVCRPSNPSWSLFDQPPTAAALMHFGRDIVVSYRGSWIAHKSQTTWAGEWTIECEKGALVWTSRGHLPEQVVIHRNGHEDKVVPLPKLRYEDRSGCLDAFVRAVRSGRQPETAARDNIGTVRFINAMIKSSRSGREVRL